MECNNSNRNRNRKWTQQPWFKVMSHNNQAAVGSIKSQQRICGPFQLKALRDFTPTLFQAGPTDKKTAHFIFYVATGATLERGQWIQIQSLNVYNGLNVLHFKTLKHASSCVKKLREDTSKKKYYLIQESCSWHRGDEVVMPAAFARYLGKLFGCLCGYFRQTGSE